MNYYNAQVNAIDKNEVRRYAGLRNSTIDEKLLERAIDEVLISAQSRGVWKDYPYSCAERKIEAEDIVELQGNSIGKHLEGATRVVVLALTIGEAVEEQIEAYFKKGEYALAVLMDAAATELVEASAEKLELTIKEKFSREGYEFTWRFSPGYGDWELTAQREILPLLDAKRLELSLSTGLMLIPRKSITAIIGLIPNGAAVKKKGQRGCQGCPRLDCPSRRK